MMNKVKLFIYILFYFIIILFFLLYKKLKKSLYMKTIVITGSSSGIGKESAKLFSSKGWTVIATMRKPEEEKELTNLKNVYLYALDITNIEQVKRTSEEILKNFDVDVLFNNAGYGMKFRFEDMTEEIIKNSLDTNISGMVRVTQQFIPHFKKKKSGIILTTTSLAGEIGLVLDGVYSADKWALTGISEMLYYELAPFNIQVKTLVPGVVKTGFISRMNRVKEIPEEYKDIIDKQLKFIIPDYNEIESAIEAANDAYNAVTDGDKDRMCYITGKVAKEILEKREKMGNENFRKYFKNYLLGNQ